jgi:NTE family protein
MRGDDLDEFLAGTALCRRLTDDLRTALAARFVPRSVQGGDVVLREGEPADGLYLVRSGRLQVRRVTDEADDQVVGEIGRGEVVGEAALLTEGARTATVVALRDSELLHLSVEAFERLVADHPELLRPIATQVVERMVAARDRRTRAPGVLAVVPLHDGAVETASRLAAALQRLLGDAVAVGESSSDELERDHELVVVVADGSPDGARRSFRQADVVVLVADAGQGPGATATDAALAEHRRRLPVPVELVLVHPRHRETPSGTRRWLAARTVRRHHHVHADSATDLDRVARLLTDRAIGLVLSGGGARGMAEIGVLEAMVDLGIPIDAVGGTSAGSLVACAIARGWPPARVREVLRAGMVEGRTPLDVTVPVASLAAGRRVTERLRAAAGEVDVEDLWLDFFCVSTNLSRAAPHVHRTGLAWRAIRASMSIPGIFPPVPMGDEVLVDGGLVDNLPVDDMRRGHHGITVVAVDVGEQKGFLAGDLPDTAVVDGWRLLVDRLHPRRVSPDVAGILTVLARLTELGGGEAGGADRGDLTVVPDVRSFAILDFGRFDELVAVGRQEGERVLGPWWEDYA